MASVPVVVTVVLLEVDVVGVFGLLLLDWYLCLFALVCDGGCLWVLYCVYCWLLVLVCFGGWLVLVRLLLGLLVLDLAFC